SSWPAGHLPLQAPAGVHEARYGGGKATSAAVAATLLCCTCGRRRSASWKNNNKNNNNNNNNFANALQRKASVRRARRRASEQTGAELTEGPMLPGSDHLSMAPALLQGETKAQRARRMLLEAFSSEPWPAATQVPETTSQELCAAGMQKLRQGEAAAAKELFAQAVLADADNPEALFGVGLYYELAHEPHVALQWMDAAIESQPNHVMAWVLRSKYLENRGELEEALRGYEQALRLKPRHAMALSRRNSLLAHQRVYIEPVGSWEQGVAEAIGAAGGAEDWQLPEWQENFLQPLESPFALKQPLLSGGVMAWDNVLSQELLAELDTAADHYCQFTFTNGWVSSGSGASSTVWLPAGSPPVTAPEVAARSILQRILRDEEEAFAGVEYWGRVRSVNLGADLHYDQAEDALDLRNEWVHGNPWRPQWSSVLYLTDEGGPTVILDQVHCEEGRHMPFVPQRGHLCMPKRNRLVMFRADLFHGSLPVKIWLDTPQTRQVFIFNFWRRHRPEEPHCQRPDYRHHLGMRGLELSPQRAAELAAPTPEAPQVLQPQTLRRPEDMPHSSDLGYLQVALPMPSMAQLQKSSGFFELDWAAAAADWLHEEASSTAKQC
ncbi:unnamed protein product, partial [Polarella glacialis]